MSSIFQGLLSATGRLKTGVGPIASYFRSLPLNAAGEVVSGSGPITSFCAGIPRNAAGAVVGIQAAQPTDYGPGATPYGPNGELVGGGTVPAIARFYQGIPYDSAGRFCGTSTPAATVVAADLTLTPGQISPSSEGYRLSPLVGTLVPAAYGGGTVTLVQAVNDDHIRVQNTGGVQFPGISGNLTMQLPIYLGPNRIILGWVAASGWYEWVEPGIYAYFVQRRGLATTMRLSASPAGTA
jgi:hypothetical protein